MRLTPGTRAEAEACAALYHRAIHGGTAPHYSAAERAAWSPGRAPWLAARLDQGAAWLAQDGAELLGFLTATRPEPRTAYLDLFFVAPEHRRGAVAPTLYGAFCDWAPPATRLSAHASHLLRSFLERRGWTTQAREVVLRNDIPLTRWIMEKDLLDGS